MSENQPANQVQLEETDEGYYIEEVITYTRRRKVYPFFCQLENCPYCENEQLIGYHPNKKWCCDEARAEFRRRRRAAKAIAEGRIPGAVGKPADMTGKVGEQSFFYFHRLKDSAHYRVGKFDTEKEYEAEYGDSSKVAEVMSAQTALVDVLIQKIQRKFESQQVEENVYELGAVDVQVALQLISEHVEAYGES